MSPQAVARDSALERGELPMVAPRRAVTGAGEEALSDFGAT